MRFAGVCWGSLKPLEKKSGTMKNGTLGLGVW